MVDISVALKEYHCDQFQLGELAQMKKDYFYAVLQENYKYLISHLKNCEDCDPVFMLKENQENDKSHYQPQISHPEIAMGRLPDIMIKSHRAITIREAITILSGLPMSSHRR